MGEGGEKVIGPVDPMKVPRFAGPATYARLPTLDAVGRAEVAILGVPFDSGVVVTAIAAANIVYELLCLFAAANAKP